jgi:GTPase
MESSIDTLNKMASALNAHISVMREFTLDELAKANKEKKGFRVAEILVKKLPTEECQRFVDLRIVLVGGLGAGKSTFLGSLSHGVKDNGRGSARLNMLRHRHEVESGRSSSISHEMIGYDSQGVLINYATTNVSTWEQICESSSKVVTFLDTCGYQKYLRTTISGLMGYAPDYACLVISGNTGSISDEMTKEHLSIAVMLNVPVFVLVTKSDITLPDKLRHTLRSLLDILKAPWINKIPVVVQSENDIPALATQFARKGPELPIFMISNVTGANVNLLHKFFNHLPKPARMNYDELLEEPVEFQIEDVYSLSEVGIVVGGVLKQGRINIRDQHYYHLGPNSRGEFTRVKVMSIHKHRMPVQYVHGGQTATLAISELKDDNWKIQKGMVLLGTDMPTCYYEFEATLVVLYHDVGVTTGTCGIVHSGSIRQHARIVSISGANDDIIRSGEQGTCTLRFLYEPRYLCVGAEILFMEGKSKCLGKITRLIE